MPPHSRQWCLARRNALHSSGVFGDRRDADALMISWVGEMLSPEDALASQHMLLLADDTLRVAMHPHADIHVSSDQT